MSMLGSDFSFYHTVGSDGTLSFLVGQAVAYLLYPLLGWLADVYFTRYKFVLMSFITMIATTVVMATTVSLFMKYTDARQLYFVEGLTLLTGLIGLGFFKSTAIQFGMDQMLEASSSQLSTFIQWYYWSCNSGPLIILFIITGVLGFFSQCIIELTIQQPDYVYSVLHPQAFIVTGTAVLIMAGLQLVCACVGLCLLVCYKKHFNIDRTGEHPLKLIYQVLKYAWKHKCPENRSAFTYWEEDIPPRIDLGKSKYGGPFTTEEVEDTKTFFSILLLLLSLFGFHLSAHGYSVVEQLMQKQCPSTLVLLFFGEPMFAVLLTTVIGVPFIQFARRFLAKYSPNMLKRMGIGLLCCFMKEVCVLIVQSMSTTGQHCTYFNNNSAIASCYYQTSDLKINNVCVTIPNFTDNFIHCQVYDTPFLLLVIPNVLQGLSYLLVFMTALEFICAQAPLRLKGLLIGIWYALLALKYLFIEVPEEFMTGSISWKIFHSIKISLIFLSLIVYVWLSKRYRYRVRDEVVNERFLVEEKYKRDLDREEQFKKRIASETIRLIESQS